MRDEKEERKKQARSNKQTRQSNTAYPRQSLLHVHVYMQHFMFVGVSVIEILEFNRKKRKKKNMAKL